MVYTSSKRGGQRQNTYFHVYYNTLAFQAVRDSIFSNKVNQNCLNVNSLVLLVRDCYIIHMKANTRQDFHTIIFLQKNLFNRDPGVFVIHVRKLPIFTFYARQILNCLLEAVLTSGHYTLPSNFKAKPA